MFERFTERARQVIVLAQQEAKDFKHVYIGTEHILLGLFLEEEGLAARVLKNLDLDVEDMRRFLAKVVGHGEAEEFPSRIPFTPRGKKVCELALREALSLGHNYVGTEHLLLGLVRENEGVAVRYLEERGLDADKIRNEVVRNLTGTKGRTPKHDAEFLRSALVGVLNALGDRGRPCSENTKGCEGCEADAQLAMNEGLGALGYTNWAAFHTGEFGRHTRRPA